MTDSKPRNVGGEIKVATVKDSWGNIFDIIYHLEFEAEKVIDTIIFRRL